MTQDESGEINYWPAYVDALINVVLNLLFLVGVFTIGLVSLNQQALFAEQEANKRKLEALQETRSQQERQNMVKEMLRALPTPPPPPPPLPATPVTPVAPKVEQPQITEIKLKATPKIQGGTDLEIAKLSAHTALTSPEQYVSTLAAGGELSRISFEINQYAKPSEWVWPNEIKTRATQKVWSLFVLADPSNARLSREAFERLMFVRATLIKAGALPENVQMKVTPPPESVALPPGVERTVWVVERPL
jgi:hypothetical protein